MERQADNSENVEAEVGMLLAISSQLFTTRVGQIVASTNVTYTQFSILNHLEIYPEASISDLAAAMEINQPGVTKVVQRLSEAELVTVQPDPEDMRRKQVSLAPAGVTALEIARQALAEDGGAWFAGWTQANLRSFRDGLAELTTWLDNNRLEPT